MNDLMTEAAPPQSETASKSASHALIPTTKTARIAAAVLAGVVLLALLALSFTLGRATMGHAQPIVPPMIGHATAHQLDHTPGELGCRLHSRC